MPLPKLAAPNYELTLPSNGKTVRYRPFLVKEEKVLMLASESENEKDIANAIKDIIKNCIVTRSVKIDQLPSFDIEYLFLNIRGKSVGEIIDLTIPAPDDEKVQINTSVNVENVEVFFPEGHTNEVDLGNDVTLYMKYPSMDAFIESNFQGKEQDPFDIVIRCIDKIVSGEEVHESKECTKKELKDFLDSMTSDQFKKIQAFFETMPKLQHKLMVTNPESGKESEITLQGLGDFFA